MNRTLTWVNLLGVTALAILSVFQWRANRALNEEVVRLEQTRLEQLETFQEQKKRLEGYAADLETFRGQLARASSALGETERELSVAQSKIQQLTGERDQLKSSLTHWSAAVTARDEQLKQANDRLRELTADLNASIGKFNELATNYNAVVKDLNGLRPKPAVTNSP